MIEEEKPLCDGALSAEEAEEARRLFNAMQAFREVYPDMTVAQAAALLLTASAKDPISMSGIRTSLNVAASTATRAVLTLSQGAAKASGCEQGLVEQSVDPKDRRWRFAHCTPSGFRTVRRALESVRTSGDAAGKDS